MQIMKRESLRVSAECYGGVPPGERSDPEPVAAVVTLVFAAVLRTSFPPGSATMGSTSESVVRGWRRSRKYNRRCANNVEKIPEQPETCLKRLYYTPESVPKCLEH